MSTILHKYFYKEKKSDRYQKQNNLPPFARSIILKPLKEVNNEEEDMTAKDIRK